jgi:hypothetical protein
MDHGDVVVLCSRLTPPEKGRVSYEKRASELQDCMDISTRAMLRNVCHRSRRAPAGTLHVWQNSAKSTTSLNSYVTRGSAASFGDNAEPRFLSSSSSQPYRYGSEDPPSSSHLYPVYVHDSAAAFARPAVGMVDCEAVWTKDCT